jgi:hypothetical protein
MADSVEQNSSGKTLPPTWRWLGVTPRSRWLLFAGAFLALALPFLPWLTATMYLCTFCPVNGGPVITFSLNPLESYLRFALFTHPSLSRLAPFQGAILTTFVAPALLCSLWIRGRLQTWGQRIGIAVFTVWFLAFTIFCVYANYWFFSTLHQRFPGNFNWLPSVGGFAFGIMWVLLALGLLLVWREMVRNWNMPMRSDIQRQSLLGYGGAALATAGFLVWFTGFYGLYWLLPPDCPPTPVFGQAACNERFSTGEGYDALFPRSSNQHTYEIISQFSQVTYWGLSALIIFGGLALLVAFWLRHSTPAARLWHSIWSVCLLVLNGLSLWGVARLAASVSGDVWTNGWLVTLLGLALIGAGLLTRWRAPEGAGGHIHADTRASG